MSLPNILYLHSHDTGRQIEPYGTPVSTPNLLNLARAGTTFRQAFAAASSCSASRASFYSGMYPHQNGMTGLAHRGWMLFDYQKTLVNFLKKAGYRTSLMGEHHIVPDENTELIGFDETHLVGNYSTADIAAAAETWLSAPPKAPWFLSCGFWDTHRTNYPDANEKEGRHGPVLPIFPDTPELRADFADFKQAVKRLDDGIGRVIEQLKINKQDTNTIIIATTDHAPGFPEYKANVSDKGLGVFLIISGPGIKEGFVYEQIVTQLDIFPTLCDLAGLKQPDWLEGISLAPALKGNSNPIHEYIFGEANYHAAYEPQRSIRNSRFRYIKRFDDRTRPVRPNIDDSPSKDFWLALKPVIAGSSLFDVIRDPLERINLAGNPLYDQTEKKLALELHNWQLRVKDPLLHGEVPAPKGAQINKADQKSADEPTYPVKELPPSTARD
jgi:N-sulfoglucosamine sulfohydrolase